MLGIKNHVMMHLFVHSLIYLPLYRHPLTTHPHAHHHSQHVGTLTDRITNRHTANVLFPLPSLGRTLSAWRWGLRWPRPSPRRWCPWRRPASWRRHRRCPSRRCPLHTIQVRWTRCCKLATFSQNLDDFPTNNSDCIVVKRD